MEKALRNLVIVITLAIVVHGVFAPQKQDPPGYAESAITRALTPPTPEMVHFDHMTSWLMAIGLVAAVFVACHFLFNSSRYQHPVFWFFVAPGLCFWPLLFYIENFSPHPFTGILQYWIDPFCYVAVFFLPVFYIMGKIDRFL